MIEKESKALTIVCCVVILSFLIMYFKKEISYRLLSKEDTIHLLDETDKIGDSPDMKLIITSTPIKLFIISRSQKDIYLQYIALVTKDFKDRCVITDNLIHIPKYARISIDSDCRLQYPYLHVIDKSEYHYLYIRHQ